MKKKEEWSKEAIKDLESQHNAKTVTGKRFKKGKLNDRSVKKT